jgi:outer membrane protein TolC
VQQHGFTLPANPSVDLPGGAAPVTGKRYALADLIDLAQELNPETRIAWNQARDAALAAGIARSAYLPRLTASVLAGAQSEHGGSAALGQSIDPRNRANGSLAVLSLQWLLFDFGQREALVTVAVQHTVIANIQFTQAHQRLIHAVSLAFLRHATARTRMDATRASQADAKGLLAAAQARLQHRQGTVMDVAQARQQVAQAALAQVAAQGEQEEAYQQLLATIGISPLATLEIADAPARSMTWCAARCNDGRTCWPPSRRSRRPVPAFARPAPTSCRGCSFRPPARAAMATWTSPPCRRWASRPRRSTSPATVGAAACCSA